MTRSKFMFRYDGWNYIHTRLFSVVLDYQNHFYLLTIKRGLRGQMMFADRRFTKLPGVIWRINLPFNRALLWRLRPSDMNNEAFA